MVLILGYLLFAMGVLILAQPASTGWYTYVEIAVSLIGLIIVVAVFITRKDTKLCGICMMAAGAFVYVVFRIVGTSEGTSIYAYPVLIASMVYLNIRLEIWGNSTIVAVNIIRVLMHINSLNGSDGEAKILNRLVSFLVACVSIRIMQILVKFNEENTAVIMKAAKKQEASNMVMVTVADIIIKHFGEAMELFNSLSENLNKNHTSMKNIADSTVSTAEAVQDEATICGAILAQADQASEVTESMVLASGRVNDIV